MKPSVSLEHSEMTHFDQHPPYVIAYTECDPGDMTQAQLFCPFP